MGADSEDSETEPWEDTARTEDSDTETLALIADLGFGTTLIEALVGMVLSDKEHWALTADLDTGLEDTGLEDTGLEALEDTGLEASEDTALDASEDTGLDASEDTGLEASDLVLTDMDLELMDLVLELTDLDLELMDLVLELSEDGDLELSAVDSHTGLQ